MDRKFLEGLNLEKDTVETIMSEYGKSIEKYKADADNLKAMTDKYNAATKEKEDLNQEISALKGQASETETKINGLNQELSDAKLTNMKTRIALDNGLPFNFADRLKGDDEEALKADAEQMAGMIKGQQAPDPLRTTEPTVDEDPYRSMLHSLNLGGED